MKEILKRIDDVVWELPKDYKDCMRVPGRIYLNEILLDELEPEVLEQIANVACLPGIYKYSIAMPDVHYGYGFPIGGVAAFDQKDGVISPGGVGFDINCLTPDTKILTEDGYFIKIKDLKENINLNIKIYNKNEGEKSSRILFVSERKENGKVIIKIITKSGRILKGSEDHPILTVEGYKPMKLLKKGELIVVYPYDGVEYIKPSNKIILNKDDINPNFVEYLKNKNLIPFKMDSKYIGTVARLLGYIFGNGKCEDNKLLIFGDKETLKNIKNDLKKLRVDILEKDKYIIISSEAFIQFINKLGFENINQIPDWIKEAPKWIKRNFLSGLFGAIGEINTFIFIKIPINEFLKDIKILLSEFEINCKIYKDKLIIDMDNDKLEFLRKINFEYNKKKKIFGLLLCEYLKRKHKGNLTEFIKKYGLIGGFVLDEIKEIKTIPYNDELYDIGVIKEEHNFIANGIVVHNCGVRVIKTNLTKDEVQPKIKELIKTLFKNVPSGLGSKGILKFSKSVMDEVLEEGVRWAVREGYGWKEDLEFIEENGCMKDADSSYVSDKAKERGRVQLGSLGSGNHFLEVQYIQEIYDREIAEVYGLEKNQVVVMVHCGSRGLGHQVCTDYLRILEKAYKRYGISIPDRQLACAPFESEEGQSYYKAMCAAANYAWANRQMITHWVRESFEDVFNRYAEDMEMYILYDVAHNIAKKEEHKIDKRKVKVVVHRKGATRAFYNHEAIPKLYRDVGQPVILPGDMGTASYIMAGTEKAMMETFGSTAHGAGRKLSRAKALKIWKGKEIKRKLESEGIIVMSDSKAVLAEEAPDAYKSVDLVADTAHKAGISKKVVRMRPLGVIKG